MMLSIRTQDRMALVLYNGCFIKEWMEDEQIYYVLKTDIIGKDVVTSLGIYDTKERALEVLDEIEKQILGDTDLNDIGKYKSISKFQNDYNNSCTIYQMPKE